MEYYLQKRTLTTWQHVTVYQDKEQGLANLNKVAGSGYSWRLVEVKVVDERLNEGELTLEPETPEASETPAEPFKSSWGVPSTNFKNEPPLEPDLKPAHASVGSVWVGNPSTKEKKRVPSAEAITMLSEGWIKAGPRTVL